MLLTSTSAAFGANTEMPYAERNKADFQVSFYAATKKATESMALFKFTKAVPAGAPIGVYSNGEMMRNFKYIDDIVETIRRLIRTPPNRGRQPVAGGPQWRVVNSGNADPMLPGDVRAIWADIDLLKSLTGYEPSTKLRDGVRHFVDWYRDDDNA